MSEHVCPTCGKTFTPAPHNHRPKFCSRECLNRRDRSGRRRTPAQALRDMARGYKRRAEQFGVAYEPGITRAKVLQRDGWVCHLCGNGIDPNATPNTAGYGSLDHVVPLASGGPHTWSNVAAAHLGCNLRKGARAA